MYMQALGEKAPPQPPTPWCTMQHQTATQLVRIHLLLLVWPLIHVPSFSVYAAHLCVISSQILRASDKIFRSGSHIY